MLFAVSVMVAVISIAGFGAINVYAAPGILRIENNSTPTDFAGEGITVRSIAFVCDGASPVAGFDPLLPSQSQEQSQPNQGYTVRVYNEAVALGLGLSDTYMSSNPQFASYVCSGIVPSQLFATINAIEEDVQTTVGLIGQTQVTLQAGTVPGVELPIIQVIPPQVGLTTGIRINTVDLRESGSTGVGGSNPASATICVDDQFTVADDVSLGNYELAPGQYSIEQVQGAQELFSCLTDTEITIDVTQDEVLLITYATVDDQDAFFGIEPEITQTSIAVQNDDQNNGGSTQDQNQDSQPIASQTIPQNQNTNQVFALADNLPLGDGLIRSGGSNLIIGLLVSVLFGVVMISDSLLSEL
jgi:hypothetical protein